MNLGRRHQVLRRKGEIKTTASQRETRIIDALAYTVSISGLFFVLDQVRIIWFEHNASGVSLPYWAFACVSSTVWGYYGYLHKERAILITNCLWFTMNVVIVVGVLMYRIPA